MNIGQSVGSAVSSRINESAREGAWHKIGETIITWVREYVEERDPVFFERWQTADDERTCPICGQLDGLVWQVGEGFDPPVHDHCRCQRVYDHVEFRVRMVERWRTETKRVDRWEYREA